MGRDCEGAEIWGMGVEKYPGWERLERLGDVELVPEKYGTKKGQAVFLKVFRC